MRKFTVEIECDNAAFDDDFEGEVYACLGRVQAKVAAGLEGGVIVDTNGNRVGTFNTMEDQ